MSYEYDINSVNGLPIPKRSISTTIELPLFLCIVAVTLSGPAISNIILYRTCVHYLNYSVAECEPFLSPIKTNATSQLEEVVQKYSTYVTTVKMVLEYVFPAFLSLFLGVWSDTYGRKLLIVWPLFGLTMTNILLTIFGMMDSLGPWWLILTAVPFSLSGGFVVLFTGAYCYVSDTSSSSSTLLRMTMIDATTSLGTVLGATCSTHLILKIGNTYLLLLSATISTIAYAFTNVWIKESLNGALQGGVSKIIDFLLIKEMVQECLKERPNRQRAQIFLLCLVRVLMVLAVFGTVGLEYLYTRQKLHWSLREYTKYSAVSTAMLFIGGFFGVIVVQKVLRLGDIIFAILISITAIADNLIKLFATKSWHMYLSSGVSIFRSLSGPLVRSFLTKTIPVEDIAKVLFLVSTAESICPMIYPIIFNSLYAYTLATFPGAIYILSSSMMVICIVLLGFVQYFLWNRSPGNDSLLNSVDT
ncbi:proton-coupled folate transporter-like [Nymphalis io]|uniref:proton-coupled folate transporter-like n=1 Tax=Inachis io TaxID=171585 RepID=UPI0021693BC0|nr:proton-coupled folate transporter-like [Nymphalis io]XP_050352437.1 proton-coupled folate transporter-like [Nymphalis io]XP_050352438.1 proton-coupled folate transporter-like [Nymphalis io]